MERLTFDGNFCDIASCTYIPCRRDKDCCSQKRVWERLKEYEDIGFTPDALRQTVESARDIKELIQELRDAAPRADWTGWGKSNRVGEKMLVAADRLEALLAENAKQKTQVQKWVSVDERLPKDEKPVLAYYGFDNAGDGYLGMMFVGVLSYFCFDPEPHWQHADTNLVVTHWMPLPEPPSTEGVE